MPITSSDNLICRNKKLGKRLHRIIIYDRRKHKTVPQQLTNQNTNMKHVQSRPSIKKNKTMWVCVCQQAVHPSQRSVRLCGLAEISIALRMPQHRLHKPFQFIKRQPLLLNEGTIRTVPHHWHLPQHIERLSHYPNVLGTGHYGCLQMHPQNDASVLCHQVHQKGQYWMAKLSNENGRLLQRQRLCCENANSSVTDALDQILSRCIKAICHQAHMVIKKYLSGISSRCM